MPYAMTVLFAVQAAVRLYQAGHRVYVDGTRSRELLLPLPAGPPVDIGSAEGFFTNTEQGKSYVERYDWLKAEIDAHDPLSGSPRAGEIVQLYRVTWLELHDRPDGDQGEEVGFAPVSADELNAMLTVRQWARDEAGAPASGLQVIGGSLLNIAVDYFATMPGAVSTAHPLGRALHGVLAGFDQVDFAREGFDRLPGTLLTSILDTVAKTPELLVGGAKERKLVEGVARTLAKSASERLAGVDSLTEIDAATWLHTIAHGVLKGAAETILADPKLYVPLADEAQRNVVTDVAAALADLVIGDDALTFRRLLSDEGVNTIAKAFLASVAENPEFASIGNEGVRKTIAAVAGALGGQDDLLKAELLPEVARLILEKSAENAELFFDADIRNDPTSHLLVTAAKSLFGALAEQPAAGAWRPQLSRKQMLGVFETVVAEVVDNPAWLAAAAGQAHPRLEVVVKSTLAALAKFDGKRISAPAAAAALTAALKAAARQPALLDGAAGDAADAAIGAAIDAILDPILNGQNADPAAHWTLARTSALTTALEVGLSALAKHGANADQISILRGTMEKLSANEFTLEALPAALDAALEAA